MAAIIDAVEELSITTDPVPPQQQHLPKTWLQRLASAPLPRPALLALSRTCTTLSDAVRRHRVAEATCQLPLESSTFGAVLDRLERTLRRCARVNLVFAYDERLPCLEWTRTEPQVTHVLQCLKGRLAGALGNVVGIDLAVSVARLRLVRLAGTSSQRPARSIVFRWCPTQNMEQSALVPALLPLLCPNLETFRSLYGDITQHLAATAPPAAADPSLPTPSPCHTLTSLTWLHTGPLRPPLAEHLRQQLSSLPSLRALTVHHLDGAAAALHSGTVTRLTWKGLNATQPGALARLPAQFPSLRALHAPDAATLDDGAAAALLAGLPQLERLSVNEVECWTDASQARSPWRHLSVGTLDVGAVARLPLGGLESVECRRSVMPSRDAAAAARVAEAVRRCGGLGLAGAGLDVVGADVAALLATLPALLAALPPGQRRRLTVRELDRASNEVLRWLGELVAGGAVPWLRLEECSLAEDAWGGLLAGLPEGVVELELATIFPWPTEEQLLAACAGATRPVTLRLVGGGMGSRLLSAEAVVERVRARLRGESEGGPVELAWCAVFSSG